MPSTYNRTSIFVIITKYTNNGFVLKSHWIIHCSASKELYECWANYFIVCKWPEINILTAGTMHCQNTNGLCLPLGELGTKRSRPRPHADAAKVLRRRQLGRWHSLDGANNNFYSGTTFKGKQFVMLARQYSRLSIFFIKVLNIDINLS